MEELVELGAKEYVELVKELAADLAPVRPWWHKDLSPDQQLWRWISGPRDEIMTWIVEAGAHMGWETVEEVLQHLEELFTSPRTEVLLPLHVQAAIPLALIEMVQAAGPKDTAKHIRKMVRMEEGRLQALAYLQNEDQPNVPEPTQEVDQPPTAPVELLPGEGYPAYGHVPRESPPAFGAP